MDNYNHGDRVFAKVRGFPCWPARIDGIIEMSGRIKYNVFFYGTYEVYVYSLCYLKYVYNDY